MLTIDNMGAVRQHGLYMDSLKHSKVGALMQKNFFEEIFPALAQHTEFAYPYKVGIPKSLNAMLEGNFEPAYTITVTKPVQGIYTQNWFGDTIDGFYLHGCGYVNGDNRYLAKQKLDDADIHMILAGATGQGKSVTLNSIILTACSEYAPWELNLTMCDAKIVEFKTYATKFPMPHIRSIAATGDADYLISVLANLHNEMQVMNSVFTVAGVKNIKSFRKKFLKRNADGKIVYYLALPQNLIVIDEFQTMFKMAAKRTKEIIDILDGFGRLGRNTGYHLLLASQELGSDIPKGMLGNIKVRAAMGCSPAVSTTILGNDGAAAIYGTKGALIINTNANEDKNKEKNVRYRVPFAPDDELAEIGTSIIKNGDALGYKRTLSFYDEQQHVYQKDYEQYLRSFSPDPNRFLLGEPSFVMNDDEQIVKLNLTGEDIENICVFTGTNKNLKRNFKMLETNVKLQEESLKKARKGNIMDIVICGDVMFENDCKASEIATKTGNGISLFFDSKSYETNQGFTIAQSMIDRRKLALEIDKKVYARRYSDMKSDEFFDSLNVPVGFDNELNKSRCYYMLQTLSTDKTFRQAFFPGITKVTNDHLAKVIKAMFSLYKSYNLANEYASYEKLPKVYVWLLGLNKIQGLGRDMKSKFINSLKQSLMDCSQVNIRYLVFTTTFENLTDLKDCMRWYLCEDLSAQNIGRIKATDDYPNQVGGGLEVLFEPSLSKNRCCKFKKMFLDGELPPVG